MYMNASFLFLLHLSKTMHFSDLKPPTKANVEKRLTTVYIEMMF